MLDRPSGNERNTRSEGHPRSNGADREQTVAPDSVVVGVVVVAAALFQVVNPHRKFSAQAV